MLVMLSARFAMSSGPGMLWDGVDFDSWAIGNYTYDELHVDFGDYANLFNSYGVTFPLYHATIVTSGLERALRITYPEGLYSDTGSGASWRAELFSPRRSLVLAFTVRFDDDFDFVRGGKVHGICSRNCYSNGDPVPGDGMSARFMWRPVLTGEGARLVVYTYHTDMPGVYGQDFPLLHDAPRMVVQPDASLWVPETGETFVVGYEPRDQLGSWEVMRVYPGMPHQLVLRVNLNHPASRNGSIQAWLDGELGLNVAGFEFAVAGADPQDYLLQFVLFQTFFGGGDVSWAPPRDVFADFDDFLILEATPLWGDVDGNCAVEMQDLFLQVRAWRDACLSPECDSAMDTVPDGRIDLRDLITTLGLLGAMCNEP